VKLDLAIAEGDQFVFNCIFRAIGKPCRPVRGKKTFAIANPDLPPAISFFCFAGIFH
jgi:hypothetical protein